MNKTLLLRLLVVANVLLAFASVGAEGFFGWTLPPVLAGYEHARFIRHPFSGVGDLIHFVLLATNVLCAFAAWISLMSFWRHARGLYLASLGTWLLLILVSGPAVSTSIGAMFRTMDGLTGGAILGLVYFTDLARRFDRAPEREAAAAMNVATDRA